MEQSDFSKVIYEILATQEGMYLKFLESKRLFKDSLEEYFEYFRLLIEEGEIDKFYDEFVEANVAEPRISQDEIEKFNWSPEEAYNQGQMNTLNSMGDEYSKIEKEILEFKLIIDPGSIKLTEPLIAKICFYLGKTVTRTNQFRIAKEFKFAGKGAGIYQDYTYWLDPSNRKGDPGTRRMFGKKRKDYDIVYQYLIETKNDDAAKRAKTDMDTYLATCAHYQ